MSGPGVFGDPEEDIRTESDAESEAISVSEFVGTAFTRWKNMKEDQLLESGTEDEDNDITVINLSEAEEASSMALTGWCIYSKLISTAPKQRQLSSFCGSVRK